jgi:hypothetical protein
MVLSVSATEKISVSLGKRELLRARSAARRSGVSLSAFLTAAVRDRLAEQERREAAQELLETFSPNERATSGERAELLALWARPRRMRVRS